MDPESFRLSLMSGLSYSLLISSAMWGITSIQIVSYYHTFKTDPLYLKIAVGSLWVCETLSLALHAATLYDLIFYRGTFSFVPLKLYVAAAFASIIQTSVQILYAFRIYKIWAKIYIPLMCWTGSIYCLGAGLAMYFILMGHTVAKGFQLAQKYNWLVFSWYSVAAAVDIAITLSMCYILRRNRDQIRKRTLRMLDKLVLWTVQTGTVTSLMALAIVATYDTIWTRLIWFDLTIVITPLYTLTMVALLNGRSLLRTIGGDGVDVISTFDLGSVGRTQEPTC